MSSANQTTASAQISSFSSSISSASSATPTASAHIKKKLKTPTPLSLGTYKELIDLIIKDFSPYDAPKDAIYEMKELKMGNTTIEEHVTKFKMLVTKSKFTKNDAVVEYFRETLPISLQRNIMSLSTPPTDLDGWYEWAIKLQNNFLWMKRRQHHLQHEQEDEWERAPKVLFWP